MDPLEDLKKPVLLNIITFLAKDRFPSLAESCRNKDLRQLSKTLIALLRQLDKGQDRSTLLPSSVEEARLQRTRLYHNLRKAASKRRNSNEP